MPQGIGTVLQRTLGSSSSLIYGAGPRRGQLSTESSVQKPLPLFFHDICMDGSGLPKEWLFELFADFGLGRFQRVHILLRPVMVFLILQTQVHVRARISSVPILVCSILTAEE